MSIQDWAAIGEIVSAIAIIVSLIYVGAHQPANPGTGVPGYLLAWVAWGVELAGQ